jgi:platelet-activating factor acetylhydrolase
MPFLQFPEPTGPYSVGQCDCMWQSDGPQGRKLVVRVWYPVLKEHTINNKARAPWLPETYGAKTMTYAEAYAKFMWRPGINSALIGTLGFLPLMYGIKTKAFLDVPLAELPSKLRPLIYSHGMGGSRSCYSAVCVDLASQGYLVVAPEHADGSASINVLPDKTVVEHKCVFFPSSALYLFACAR